VRALTARVRPQLPPGTDLAAVAAGLAQAVAGLDAADAAYRAAIDTLLPAAKARAVLEALTSFRTRGAEIRADVRRAVDFGDFDPLDTYAPDRPGSHGESVRRASFTDSARGEVAALRVRLNEELAAVLERVEIERLVAAKQVRNAAFERHVRAALPPVASDKLATQLLLLVDGWY
jgi:nucleotide-binding universal stress UspA family protein